MIPDRFGALVRSKSAATVTILLSSPESGIISQSFYAFGTDGRCDLDANDFAIVWPGRNSQYGRTFDSNLTLTISIEDKSGSDIQFAPFVAQLQRAECPEGTEYDLHAFRCSACYPSQYGMKSFEGDFKYIAVTLLIIRLIVDSTPSI